MQTLLTDIELDIQELKCVMQAVEQGNNPALREVARRNIRQMQARLSELERLLDETTATTPVETAAVAEAVPAAESVTHEAPVEADLEEPVPTPVVVPVFQEEPVEPAPAEEQVHVPAEEVVPTVQPTSILAERIRSATDLRHAISLNDAFRFTRELFKGDGARMNEVVEQLGNAATLDEALRIFYSTVVPDEENEATADFIELLKKYFS